MFLWRIPDVMFFLLTLVSNQLSIAIGTTATPDVTFFTRLLDVLGPERSTHVVLPSLLSAVSTTVGPAGHPFEGLESSSKWHFISALASALTIAPLLGAEIEAARADTATQLSFDRTPDLEANLKRCSASAFACLKTATGLCSIGLGGKLSGLRGRRLGTLPQLLVRHTGDTNSRVALVSAGLRIAQAVRGQVDDLSEHPCIIYRDWFRLCFAPPLSKHVQKPASNGATTPPRPSSPSVVGAGESVAGPFARGNEMGFDGPPQEANTWAASLQARGAVLSSADVRAAVIEGLYGIDFGADSLQPSLGMCISSRDSLVVLCQALTCEVSEVAERSFCCRPC